MPSRPGQKAEISVDLRQPLEAFIKEKQDSEEVSFTENLENNEPEPPRPVKPNKRGMSAVVPPTWKKVLDTKEFLQTQPMNSPNKATHININSTTTFKEGTENSSE